MIKCWEAHKFQDSGENLGYVLATLFLGEKSPKLDDLDGIRLDDNSSSANSTVVIIKKPIQNVTIQIKGICILAKTVD